MFLKSVRLQMLPTITVGEEKLRVDDHTAPYFGEVIIGDAHQWHLFIRFKVM